ncbi:hypothetical protein OESDEN_16654 [Oesophagostomum dentatum]|uniref:Trafficking protein particle complex subunit 13 N-terminal domain-containing protein n=1 Tax=Oesophagostomum dentatum TaxID=61180 RepID=A0A0B1SKF3_OESDE|nr:hypothetical protein OESDEN_16654 [Oesophagostomum dentatum]
MFENIYLGETFTFYMDVVNESDQKVTDVSVKVNINFCFFHDWRPNC